MLIRLDADLEIEPPHERRHREAIVIHELEIAAFGDHDVGVLQVAVRDAGRMQFIHEPDPRRRQPIERRGIALLARMRTQSKSVSPLTQSMMTSGYHLPSLAERIPSGCN